MFREAWRLGNGAITAEHLFTVANECGWFYKMLMVKFSENLSDLETLQRWKDEKESREDVLSLIESTGVPLLLREAEKYEDLLREDNESHLSEMAFWSVKSIYNNYQDFIKPVQSYLDIIRII